VHSPKARWWLVAMLEACHAVVNAGLLGKPKRHYGGPAGPRGSLRPSKTGGGGRLFLLLFSGRLRYLTPAPTKYLTPGEINNNK
jgi:hypothetical protein